MYIIIVRRFLEPSNDENLLGKILSLIIGNFYERSIDHSNNYNLISSSTLRPGIPFIVQLSHRSTLRIFLVATPTRQVTWDQVVVSCYYCLHLDQGVVNCVVQIVQGVSAGSARLRGIYNQIGDDTPHVC